MSKVVAQTSTFPVRRMELLSAELRLLKAAIVQLHDRFDLLLAEIGQMEHEHHAEHSPDAVEHHPEEDQKDLRDCQNIEQCEHEVLGGNTGRQRKPRSLSENLAQVEGGQSPHTFLFTLPSHISPEDTNPTRATVLQATESAVEGSEAEMPMALHDDVP